MQKSRLLAVMYAMFLVLVPLTANSSIISYNFTGFVNSSSGNGIPTGSFSGVYTYDTSTVSNLAGPGTVAEYGWVGGLITFSDGVMRTLSNGTIQVGNDVTLWGGIDDYYRPQFDMNVGAGFGFTLRGANTVFSDTTLPTDDSFVSLMSISELTSSSGSISGSITSVTAVPVPAAAWLLGSGLLGLVGIGRRKKTA